MTEIKRLEFSEGVVTTKPTDLVPNSPDGLVNTHINNIDTGLTMVVNRRYLVDTASGTISATMPAGASEGDRVQIIDNGNEFDTNNMTVFPGVGDTINGTTSDVLSSEGEALEFVYDLANTNWVKIALASSSGVPNNIATSSSAGILLKNKWQTLKLDGDVTTDADADLSDIDFNNLVIGNVYRVTILPYIETSTADDNAAIIGIHDGNNLLRARVNSSGSSLEIEQFTSECVFTATATTFTWSGESTSANAVIRGNNTFDETWAKIEELNNYETETTDFT